MKYIDKNNLKRFNDDLRKSFVTSEQVQSQVISASPESIENGDLYQMFDLSAKYTITIKNKCSRSYQYSGSVLEGSFDNLIYVSTQSTASNLDYIVTFKDINENNYKCEIISNAVHNNNYLPSRFFDTTATGANDLKREVLGRSSEDYLILTINFLDDIPYSLLRGFKFYTGRWRDGNYDYTTYLRVTLSDGATIVSDSETFDMHSSHELVEFFN